MTIVRCSRLCIFLAATLLAGSGASRAQTQMEMNEQAHRDFQNADQRLSTVYSALMAKISSAGQANLKQAEETWRRFRDQECAFETMGTVHGSIHPMVFALCKTRLTLQRVKDLEDQLNCSEGDLSCGNQ